MRSEKTWNTQIINERDKGTRNKAVNSNECRMMNIGIHEL